MDTRRTNPLIWLLGRQMGKCRAQRIDCTLFTVGAQQ